MTKTNNLNKTPFMDDQEDFHLPLDWNEELNLEEYLATLSKDEE